jgi:hypothetical protein
VNEVALAKLRSILVEAAKWRDQGLPGLLDIGQMGEAIVEAMHPDWTRAPRGTVGFDFTDTERRTVQVKTRASDARTHDKIRPSADRIIVLKLRDTGWDVLCDRLTSDLFPVWPAGKTKLPVYNRMHAIDPALREAA